MSNKYIGFRMGSGAVIGITSMIMLFLPPYIIGMYKEFMAGESSTYLPILPEFILGLFDLFDLELMRFNARLFAPFLLLFALIKKKTAVRVIVNICMLILLIYAYFIGSNIFTFGLPTEGFARIKILLNLVALFTIEGLFSQMLVGIIFNFQTLAIMIILTASLGTIKSLLQFLEVLKEED